MSTVKLKYHNRQWTTTLSSHGSVFPATHAEISLWIDLLKEYALVQYYKGLAATYVLQLSILAPSIVVPVEPPFPEPNFGVSSYPNLVNFLRKHDLKTLLATEGYNETDVQTPTA